MKATMMAGIVERPIEAVTEDAPAVARYARWVDSLGADSPYDYDPVWQRCVDLKVAPASHCGGMGWPDRVLDPELHVQPPRALRAEPPHLRSLFLDGVTQRFPALRVAFLEGGVGWASNLYNDLVGHWEKRNRGFLDEHLRPTNLDPVEYRRCTSGTRRITRASRTSWTTSSREPRCAGVRDLTGGAHWSRRRHRRVRRGANRRARRRPAALCRAASTSAARPTTASPQWRSTSDSISGSSRSSDPTSGTSTSSMRRP